MFWVLKPDGACLNKGNYAWKSVGVTRLKNSIEKGIERVSRWFHKWVRHSCGRGKKIQSEIIKKQGHKFDDVVWRMGSEVSLKAGKSERS